MLHAFHFSFLDLMSFLCIFFSSVITFFVFMLLATVSRILAASSALLALPFIFMIIMTAPTLIAVGSTLIVLLFIFTLLITVSHKAAVGSVLALLLLGVYTYVIVINQPSEVEIVMNSTKVIPVSQQHFGT